MLKRLEDLAGEAVRIRIDGQTVEARLGDSVAAALLLSGLTATRTTVVSGALRAPYCMMGVCFECLVTIDGVANRQACMIDVKEGMSVQTQIEGQSGRAIR
ncbi:(2Fe-2S)-binding protein [Aminobacter sp. AP02]|uniref:(2Fe-2S)-binding protein n=1 Tax=Aminobacter sp. AP02 TaxID=2135737 RepID=UPI000D6D4BA2|nr:(2Fe-2S)-binding protein [Aminobacter sp. AP02]PWK60325.1 2Fe-2S iron-sulfur cluster protein [Aminobacter sp. AP02]